MPESRPLRINKIPDLLKDADFSDDLSNNLSIEIDDVKISDNDLDYVPYCDSDNN